MSMNRWARPTLALLLGLAAAAAGTATAARPVAPPGTGPAAGPPAASAASGARSIPGPARVAEPAAPVGRDGERIYDHARPRLLQVRTLLKTQDSQSSVGSGFLVEGGELLVTNYHVVSEYALEPRNHRLVYATVDGRQGALQLLAFDVVHDLALLRPAEPGAWAGRGGIALRPADQPLPRGARIFSLGNPLDVGFAVAEGNYNGPVERSFLPTIFFGGSLSAGMSGGPALDERGRLVGVNVAARRDGEQVSFLVPAAYVARLIERGRSAEPIVEPAWPEVGHQLMAHETALVDAFVAQPWRSAGHPRYRIPVPQETWMRCWGRGTPQAARGLQLERSDCVMDHRIFVSGALQTGFLTVRHEAYDGRKIGAWRFAQRYSASFGNEFLGNDGPQRTAARCVEDTVAAGADDAGAAASPLRLRAVVCLRAYKKLEGLYDLSVLVATLDGRVQGAQARLDATGVSLEGAQRLVRHHLGGFGWAAGPEVSAPAVAP